NGGCHSAVVPSAAAKVNGTVPGTTASASGSPCRRAKESIQPGNRSAATSTHLASLPATFFTIEAAPSCFLAVQTNRFSHRESAQEPVPPLRVIPSEHSAPAGMAYGDTIIRPGRDLGLGGGSSPAGPPLPSRPTVRRPSGRR